ncbi:MAG TPA: hypothetical protein VLA16_03770 [Ideonella sp.]|nr:hypothetical protein [Ideonella sp.]
MASDGNLYGTATRGGPADGGTLIRLNCSTGELRVLHAFAREGSLGGYPTAATHASAAATIPHG